MNYERAKTYLKQRGQEHLLAYYDELSDAQRLRLLKDIENTNFSVLKNLNKEKTAKQGKISPIDAVSIDEINRRKSQFETVGLNLLSEGKVGAVLLAGGQGTRLGFDGPKGTFDMGVTRSVSIFELQMRNITEVTKITGRHFPLFIMTSVKNNAETIEFFEINDYFGYPRDRVHFFIQEVAPTCDENGKVYLDEKTAFRLRPTATAGGIRRS